MMRMGIKAKAALLRDDHKERTTAIIFEVFVVVVAVIRFVHFLLAVRSHCQPRC